MIPEEMHDKIIQIQMRNANDERRKSIKKRERLPMWEDNVRLEVMSVES
jgi:hypothetical protein